MKAKALEIRNTLFWVILAIFAAMIVIPIVGRFLGLGHKLTMIVFASLLIIFGILAVVLAVLTVRAKEPVMRKLFFMVTGVSAAGILIFGILHNIVYGLCVKFGWVYWGEGGDEPVFFILALFVFPALYALGSLGSIVILIRESLKKRNVTMRWIMKIGRLIERNVFTFLSLFFFISILLVQFFHYFIFREEYWDEDAKFIFCWYASKYIFWPYEFLFKHEIGTYLLGPVLDIVIICAISLTSFIAADFIWRKIFWNKKKSIDNALSKTPKLVILQIVTGLVKWTGRLFACLAIPFLWFVVEDCIYQMNDKECLQDISHQLFGPRFGFASAFIAIIGCIIGWRFPLIGAITMSAWFIPFLINEGQIFPDFTVIFFYLAATAFLATWVLRRFSERTSKKCVG